MAIDWGQVVSQRGGQPKTGNDDAMQRWEPVARSTRRLEAASRAGKRFGQAQERVASLRDTMSVLRSNSRFLTEEDRQEIVQAAEKGQTAQLEAIRKRVEDRANEGIFETAIKSPYRAAENIVRTAGGGVTDILSMGAGGIAASPSDPTRAASPEEREQITAQVRERLEGVLPQPQTQPQEIGAELLPVAAALYGGNKAYGATRASNLVSRLSQGGRVAQTTAKAAPFAAESAAASASYAAAADTDRGLGRELAEGAAYDAAGQVLLRGGGRAIRPITRRIADRRTTRALNQLEEAAGTVSDDLKIKGSKIDSGPLNRLNKKVSQGVSKFTRPVRESTVGEKTKELLGQAQVKFQRSEAPILRALRQGEKAGKLPEGSARRIETLMRDVKAAESVAEYHMRNSPEWNRVIAGQGDSAIDKKQLEQLNDYVEARAELNLMNIDNVKNPQRRAKYEKVIADAPEDFVQRYDSLVQYNRNLTDLLVEEGIIDQKTANAWRRTNDEYIRIQRVVDDLSEMRGGRGGGSGSIRGTTAAQRRLGSERQVRELVQVSAERTQQLYREILRNRAANELVGALQEIGLANPARTADNVLTRASLREALGESRDTKRAYQRLVTGNKKRVRRLQTEINQLQNRLSNLQVKTVRRELRRQKRPPLSDDAAAAIQSVNTENVDEMFESLLELKNTPYWPSIRKAITARKNNVASALDDLDIFSKNLDSLNAQRKAQYEEILRRADEKVRNKPTISRRVGGVDEVYTTLPEIEAAAKSWGRAPLGAVGRILASPVRLLKATVTGALNPAYVPKSIIRDSVESYNLSRNAMATHSPQNIVGALSEATGKSDLFQEFMRTEGSNTFIDYLRKPKNATNQILRQSRLELPKTKRAATVVKSPSQWYRSIEDASRWQEIMGRYQNFRGAYNDAVEKGMAQADALVEARWAARNNQTDFFQTGDWSQVLNALYPYWNSSVQGGARIARAFKEKPVTTSAKVVASLQVPSAIAATYNLSDPRRAKIYLDLQEYERENNWVFVMPGSEKDGGRWSVLKIPKPAGVGEFSNPVEKMIVGMYGHDPVEFGDFAQALTQGFGSPIDTSSTSAAVGSGIPHIIKPTVQSVANYDFFTGREIVPDWLQDENPNEPFKQHFDSTSSTAREIGKLLDISPLTAEKFMQDTFGETGRNVLFGIDKGLQQVGVGEAVGGRSPVESVTRQFASAAGGRAEQAQRARVDEVLLQKQSISDELTEDVKRNDVASASIKARRYNARIDDIIRTIQEDDRIDMSQKTLDYLEGRKFPIENGVLSPGSVSYRRNK